MNYYNYFTEIEETFIRRRGKNLLLSPLDWALIESWQEREIPLSIVLRGIEKVFDTVDAQPNRKRSIKSIAYCKEEVEAQFAEWLETQTGKANGASEKIIEDTLSENGIETHIDGVIAQLKEVKNESLREAIERAVSRLNDLKQTLNGDTEGIEKNLTEIENFLDEALVTNADSAHLNKLKKETAEHLSSYQAKMKKDVYEHTFELMLIKKLREEAEIPSFSLFYL
ncbi:MAG TPA: hypothetical protein PKY59_09085 [Pyrinomonadaceae bacterium]|nr:hypothetical protein [Pyrinomonadaceae bacterium]